MGRRRKNQDTTGEEVEQHAQSDATREHNVRDRKETIVGAFNRLYAIDQEIAAIVEDEIKELRDEKSNLKKLLRETFNLTSPIVNARYHSYRLERKAEEGNDDVTQDAIREMFEALPIGGQGSLIPGLVASDTRVAPPAFEAERLPSPEEARGIGYQDGERGTFGIPVAMKARPKLKAAYEEGYEMGKAAAAEAAAKAEAVGDEVEEPMAVH